MSAAVLIIDDEDAICRLVQRAAERGGFAVDSAATAAAGLALARRPGVEIVLLDLGLPDRDGLELIPLLKEAGRTVIVLTARGAASEKVAALDLGADDYLVKPFDSDELLARDCGSRCAIAGPERGTASRRGRLTIDLPATTSRQDGERWR